MHALNSDNVYLFRSPQPMPVSTSRRISLWELPSGCHCPVIGSCLRPERLRELLDELFQGRSDLSEFELHSGVVRECASSNPVSELVQRELDRAHAEIIRVLAFVESESGLLDAWAKAAGRGDIAGTLWAILTHPRCSVELAERLLRELHMVQHRAMDAVRLQLDRGDCLAAENARLQASLADRARECERLRERLAAPSTRSRRWRRFLSGAASPDSAQVSTP